MCYLKESKDDLWFYIGFFVVGFYVYDLVDSDIYFIMICKISGSWLQCVIVNLRGIDGMFVLRRGKGFQLRYLIFKESQELGEENVENLDCEFLGFFL